MTPVLKTFTFAIPEGLKAGLQLVKLRDGISEAEQIRRAIAAWLEAKGAIGPSGRTPANALGPATLIPGRRPRSAMPVRKRK